MNNGFITLHRKITEWEWYADGNTFRLFLHLLLKANHEPKKWKGIPVERGQCVTGRKILSKELCLTEQQIRTSINKLKSTNEITIKATNKYSVVTVVNYNVYQAKKDKQQPTEQPTTHTTSNQQVTTNNNDNNKNNIYRAFAHLKITMAEKDKIIDSGYTINQLDDVLDQIENFAGNKKYKSLNLTARNWLKRNANNNQGKQKPKLNVVQSQFTGVYIP